MAYQDNVELANGIGGRSVMFRNIIRSLKSRIFWEECYKRQEEKGISIFGMCGGKLNPIDDKIDDKCLPCVYFVCRKNVEGK